MTQSQMERLRLSHVTKRYPGGGGVEDLCLEVAAGEILCLLGPSGCGKSTTLRVVAGVDRPDDGEIWLHGDVVAGRGRHAPPEARRIGLMFQDFALFPHLTAAQNVAFGVKGPARAARAQEELERVGLGGRGDAFPHELSGGEQQRVALARALAPKPEIMLMDEPFGALDPLLRNSVRDEALALLKEAGAAVLLVTHDPEEAMRMGDRIALMREGRIVQSGAPYNIYNHPIDRAAAEFFSEVNVVHGVVRSLQTETAFGVFLTPDLVDRADVEILIRPEHLKIDLARDGKPEESAMNGVPAPGRVARSRFIGGVSLVDVVMDYDGAQLRAATPGAFLPPPGEPIWLSLRRDRCFVFPCEAQSTVGWPYILGRGPAMPEIAVESAGMFSAAAE